MGVKRFLNSIRKLWKRKGDTLPPARSVSIGATAVDGANEKLIFRDSDGALFCFAPMNDHPYPIFSDSFDSIHNDWAKANANVSSTFMVADGKSTIVATPGSHKFSSWYNRNSIAENIVISVDAMGESPQIHLRESDHENMLIVSCEGSGSLSMADLSRGVFTKRKMDKISGYHPNASYQLVAKVFNDHLSVYAFKDHLLIHSLDYTGSAVSAMTGTLNGLGSNGLTAQFENFKSRKITEFTNMVCLGDSNTHKAKNQPAIDPGTGHLYTSVLASRFVMDGFAVSNAGVGGDKTTDITARLAADLIARKVTGARNIATLLVGVNDFHHGATVMETVTNLDILVDAILSDGWELWLMTYPPTRPYSASLRQLNDWIRQNADPKGYKVIDLYTPMTQTWDNERNPCYCWPNGNQHFPAAGHAVVADLLTSALTQRFAL